MIIQACLNGSRPKEYHPRLPLKTEHMVSDAVDCVSEGAGELHIHPRGPDGRESLSHVDELMRAMRAACPGTLVGVSTGAWIENDVTVTRECIADWRVLPDYASVNLSETDAPAILSLLENKGIGIEAGLATVEDAKRFVTLPQCDKVFRVLLEIEEQELGPAEAVLDGIVTVLGAADNVRPLLLHGFDATVWHFARVARDRRWSTRIGLEDSRLLEDNSIAASNAQLVARAVALFDRTRLPHNNQ